jgi:membrane fusion protein, multidrug efflux system
VNRPQKIALLPTLVATFACSSVEPTTYQVTKSVGYEQIIALGTIVANKHTELSAQVPGMISHMTVKLGDRVSAQQVLLQIDSPNARAAGQSEIAQSNAAKAQIKSAEAALVRSQSLHDAGYLSDAGWERATAQSLTLKAQAESILAQAQAAHEISRWQYIKAPFSGEVTAVHVSEGDWVNVGQIVLSMYSPNQMHIEAILPSSQYSTIDTKSPIKIIKINDGCKMDSSITNWSISKAIDGKSRSIEVRADLPKSTTCLPGSTVSLGIPTSNLSQEIWVPSSAIVLFNELTAVYVINNDQKPSLRQVRLGNKLGDQTSITAGLEVNEKIVLNVKNFEFSKNFKNMAQH